MRNIDFSKKICIFQITPKWLICFINNKKTKKKQKKKKGRDLDIVKSIER